MRANGIQVDEEEIIHKESKRISGELKDLVSIKTREQTISNVE
jgi:hypothetical protein